MELINRRTKRCTPSCGGSFFTLYCVARRNRVIAVVSRNNQMSLINSYISALKADHGFSAHPPATVQQISQREADLGVYFPEELTSFYLSANGLNRGGYIFHPLELLSLDWFDGWPFIEDLGLLPLLDANDSNPICVITNGPLRGFVAHIFHDGDTCLRFASVSDMFRELSSTSDFSSAYHSSSVCTLPPFSTNQAYEMAFAELVQSLDPEDDEGNSWRLRFAMDLCTDAQVTRLPNLISAGNEYVRSAAIDRLKTIDTDTARDILAAENRDYDAFVQSIRKLGPEDRTRRLNFPMLYSRRNDDGFQDWLNQLIGG